MPDEIRCPMCGKSNPADAEVCHSCQAQLKPVNFSAPDSGKPDGDLDWLRDIEAFNSSQPNKQADSEPPDWLNRIRQRSRIEEQLASMQPGSQTPEQKETPKPFEGGEDWLSTLSSAGEDETGWLNQLRDEGVGNDDISPFTEPISDVSEPQEEPLENSSQDVEERLSAFTDLEEKPSGATSPFIENEAIEDQEPASIAETESAEGKAEAPEKEEIPDWLLSLTASPEKSAAEEASATEVIPSWLEESTPAEPERKEEDEEAIPDWLAQANGQEQSPPAGLEGEEFGMPDWLKEISEEVEKPAPTGEEEKEILNAGLAAAMSIPEEAAQDQFETISEESVKAEIPQAEADQGDWLKNLEDELAQMDLAEESEHAEETGQVLPEEAAHPFESTAFSGADIPNWEEGGAEEDLSGQPFLDESGLLAAEPVENEAFPFMGDDIPDWLGDAEVAPLENAIEAAVPAEEKADLAPGEMPGWLKALRPVEAVTPQKPLEEKPQKIEAMGPLAGLQGILPAENMALRYRKPPIYSTRLKANEKQREHAALLEEVIANERQPRAIKRERANAPRAIIRIILALLLIAVVVGTLTIAPGSTAGTVSVPAGATQFHETLESVELDGPVLLAVEYAPGYSGEMRFAATAAVRKLLERGASVALISTLSTGPVLGEDLLRQAAELPGISISLAEQTANMGFLPAGITSLQQFASRPQQAVRYGLSSALDGQPVWSNPVLNGVNNLDDFSLVLVITDSVDSARAWIEQVEPALNEAPLLVVSSAQAAPMLEPYVQSGQVDGMLSGVTGGMAYEQLSQVSGTARTVRGAYQAGMAAGVVVLLLGLVLGIITSVFSRSSGRREA